MNFISTKKSKKSKDTKLMTQNHPPRAQNKHKFFFVHFYSFTGESTVGSNNNLMSRTLLIVPSL